MTPLRLTCVLLAAVVLGQGIPRGGSHSASPPRVTWRPAIAVASGEAVVTPWRMNASEWRYVDDPTVAMDGEGFVGVAWADQSRKDIFFQLYDHEGKTQLTQPVNVSKSARIFSWLPRMAIAAGASRRVYLLWQEIVFSGGSHGGEILFARSIDGGRSFGAPINLSNTPAGDGKGRLNPDLWHNGSLDLALGSDGTLHAAWTEYEGVLRYSRSTDGGESFSRPLRVAGRRANPGRGPSLCVDARRLYLAWAVGEDPRADIHLAISTDQGRTFGPPRLHFKSKGHADAPKVAVDTKGVLHLAYAQSSGGPFGRYHIRYARSTDGGRSFEPAREISGPLRGFESANFPSLSVDADGNVYMVWELFPDARGRPRGLGFAYSRDGGRTFSPPSLIPSTMDPERGFNGSRQGLLMRKLAVHGSGAIAVGNSTFRADEESRVRLLLGRTGGQ